MTDKTSVIVFGEVLFDIFTNGQQVLGGAPFNVAWHLQALGDDPYFISRVGQDELGRKIMEAIKNWGMNTQLIQTDPTFQTGRVEIKLLDGEPQFTILPDCAYDFISATELTALPKKGILYHGTLGLRNSISRKALKELALQSHYSIFLDVNLREPWWQRQKVFECLKLACLVKLNEHELHLLGFNLGDLSESMLSLQNQFQLEQVIVTQGAKGATVLDKNGKIHHMKPDPVGHIVDTVGAGDGFSAVYLHGLREGWSIEKTLRAAQNFAAKLIGIRGATTSDKGLYREFVN